MTTDTHLFQKHVPSLGTFSLRRLNLQDDLPLLHDWVNRDYARYWLMQDTTRDEVADFYRELLESEHHDAFTGLHNGKQAFLLETYDPAHEPIGDHFDVRPGDIGMHILVSPPEKPISGFTSQVFRTIMEFLFSLEEVNRVIVEPDADNDKIHPLNREVGFEYQKQIELPKKTARLAFCTHEQFEETIKQEETT